MVNLDTCVRSCNTLKDLYNKVYTSNKTEDINLCVFKIAGINELKTLTNHHLTVENLIQTKNGISITVGASVKIWKKNSCLQKRSYLGSCYM